MGEIDWLAVTILVLIILSLTSPFYMPDVVIWLWH